MSKFEDDFEKVYSVTFLKYTNCMNDCVNHNTEEMEYIGDLDKPLLVRESKLDEYRNYGGGFDTVKFVGIIEK